MKWKHKLGTIFAAFALVGMPLVAMAQSDDLVIDGEKVADSQLWSAAQKEGRLTLYSAYGESKERILVAAFTKDTGIGVDLVRMATGPMLERIRTERASKNFNGDVFRMGDQALMADLQKEDALQPYKVESYDKVDPSFIYDNGEYYIWLQSIYGLGYNSRRVSDADAPNSWKDLLDPKWKGDLAIADISAGGSTLSLYQFLRTTFGEDYWTNLAAQNPTITSGSGAVTDLLARGEVAVATVLPGTVSPTIEKGAPIKIVVPTEGFALYNNFMAVLADAPHPDAAKVFMNWSLGLPGQKVLKQIGEYPIRNDAGSPSVAGIELPSRDSGLLHEPDREKTLENRDAITAEWDKVFGRAH